MQRKDLPGNWYIIDKFNNEKYVTMPYQTKEIAEMEMFTLLKGFDENHEWRQRLFVKEIKKEAL